MEIFYVSYLYISYTQFQQNSGMYYNKILENAETTRFLAKRILIKLRNELHLPCFARASQSEYQLVQECEGMHSLHAFLHAILM